MNLSVFGVKWPVTTTMIFLATVILGLFSWTQLGVDLMPDFEIPSVSIITSYSGAGPQEIESTITEVIEENVSTVANVDEITSQSMEGVSIVNVKFEWGIDLNEATSDIRDKLDLVSKRLPEDAEKPFIFKFNTSMIPVIMLAVTAEESWEKLDTIVDRKLIDSLKRVQGVATAIKRGGDQRGILVDLDRERLQASGLSGAQIVSLLRSQNIDNPGGHIKQGQFEYLVRTPGKFTRVTDLESVVLATNPGVLRLGDVAKVVDGFLERNNDFYINGKRGVGVMVQKQSGANTVSVAGAVIAELEKIRSQLPPDVKVEVFMDTSEFIKNTVNNLTNSVLLGGVAVFFVILFFLRDIRGSIIVCTTIPTSLIITFLLMYMAGYTLNQITLSSLAIAIGMVVDNAIVVLDNIKRYLERGVSSRESAISGAVEMGTSVMASTLTTIVIFLPIIFTTGMTNIMFGQLAMIIIMALLASLVSALMLTPMMCSKLLKPAILKDNRLAVSKVGILEKTEQLYGRAINFVLDNRLKTVGVLVASFVASLGLATIVGADFMPEQDQGRLTIKFELPIATRFEMTGEFGRKIVDVVKEKVPELEAVLMRYGRSDSASSALTGSKEFSHTGQVNLKLVKKDRRQRGVKQIIEELRPELEKIPGGIIRFDSGDPMANMMGAGGAGFTLNLYGYDLKTALEWANQIRSSLAGVRGLKDLEISQDMAQPELQVIIDRQKAASLGFNVSDIGKTIETYISGNSTVKYKEGGEEYDVVVRLRESDRDKAEDISRIPLMSPSGQVIRLDNVAQIVNEFGPTSVTRNEQERYVQITGQVYGRSSGDVNRDAQAVVESIPVPPGFSWKFAGNEKERRKSFLLLFQAAALGMILVYMVMASQFESYLAPFIIGLSVPFGFMGAILALVLTGSRLSIVSLLGFLILIGIVVNNGIVLISYVNMLIRRRVPLRQALVESGISRLRPVLSTTATTVLGMLPMAMSTGEGSEVWVPLSLSVIGGLVVSTFMTLLLMPVLYSLFSRWLVPAQPKIQMEAA
ncbi:MAG TPA: efflux RND transporter permease subunit [Candidatus Rifleibacterium sp.]|nr:efflux RND transporter permease subunit [Candidatus Rifleibacterium sp.]